MATLVLTAVGTALGGPLGGAIGGLIGNQIDHAVFGGLKREGTRLKELAVSTSSYGTPVPRHLGRVRTPGTIVWSTDLVEHKDKSGGGKGKPSVANYSYSVSFAVALSSRPIQALGRIWADGTLLRGVAGDLKASGSLRLYTGHGDQPLDPLIASAEPNCPAFRGLAYCVFESLALADFGNRIPALTFEVIADDAPVTIASLLEPLAQPFTIGRPLTDCRASATKAARCHRRWRRSTSSIPSPAMPAATVSPSAPGTKYRPSCRHCPSLPLPLTTAKASPRPPASSAGAKPTRAPFPTACVTTTPRATSSRACNAPMAARAPAAAS